MKSSKLARPAEWVAGSPRRLWVAAFTLFLALAASWSIATPMGGAPDEYSHMIRAAGVARGQINGPEVMVPHTVQDIPGKFAETGVDLPAWYKQLTTLHECYSWTPAKSAGCAPKLNGHNQRIEQTSTASARYDPAYYLAVGWPSRIVSGPAGLYLMRLASAVITAALLASAVVTAGEWRRRSMALLGVFAAATPMALFLGGVVNPSGGEIASGILVWTALLSILMSPDPRLLTRRIVRLGVGGIILINIRPLGLLWLAGAVFFALLLQERGALRMVLRRKIAWLVTAVLGAGTVVMMLWTKAHPDHSVIHVPDYLTPTLAAKRMLRDSYLYIQQMLGYFGWLDTKAPRSTYWLLLGVMGLLALVALLVGRALERLAVLGMAVAIVLVPVVAQASQVRTAGMIWQGRYLLPLAVGLPLMAAFICARRLPEAGRRWHHLTGLGFVLLSVAQAGAFYFTLRRFTVGTHGPLLITRAHWQPPGGWVLWVAVYGAGLLSLVLLSRVGDRPAPGAEGGARRRGGSTGLRRSPIAAGS